MRNFLPSWSVLVIVFVASAALASEADEKLVIRTLKLSEHPRTATHNLYVSGQVATVLHFDQDVDPDPAKTKLLGWEGRFERLLVGSKKVKMKMARLYTAHGWKDRPFAARTDREEIPTGKSGQVAIVVDKSAFAEGNGVEQLLLEIYREDGYRQAYVLLDPSLCLE